MKGDALNFGRKIAEFKAKTSHFAIPLAGGLLLAALGLVRLVQALDAEAGLDLLNLVLSILFIYVAGVLLFIAFGRYQAMQTSYVLYEWGVQRHDGTTKQSMGWSQVRRVRRGWGGDGRNPGKNKGSSQKRRQTMQLIGQGGESLTIDNQPRLAGMVLGMLLVHHWPIVQGQIDQGKTVYLSRLQVSSEGLEYKQRLVPWSRIHKAQTAGHIRLVTVSGRIEWPEINDKDANDVLGYALLQRAIEYYVTRFSDSG